jgi:hypothetical protein
VVGTRCSGDLLPLRPLSVQRSYVGLLLPVHVTLAAARTRLGAAISERVNRVGEVFALGGGVDKPSLITANTA